MDNRLHERQPERPVTAKTGNPFPKVVPLKGYDLALPCPTPSQIDRSEGLLGGGFPSLSHHSGLTTSTTSTTGRQQERLIALSAVVLNHPETMKISSVQGVYKYKGAFIE